jgi:hypothetical protein
MGRLALILVATAGIGGLVVVANEAGAQLAVTCGGTIQNCPQGKKMYCNRWRPCKGKNAKVKKHCDAPVCMTERRSKG